MVPLGNHHDSMIPIDSHKEFDEDESISLRSLHSWKLSGIHNLGFSIGWYRERFQNQEVTAPFADLFWYARLNNKLSTRFSLGYLKGLDYSSLQPSEDYSFRSEVLWRPFSSLRIDVNFVQQL